MNNNVLDFKKGSKRTRYKESLNTKFYRVSEDEIKKISDQINNNTEEIVEVFNGYKKLSEDYKQLFCKYKELAEKYNSLGDRFLKENDDVEDYFEMFSILLDTIVLSDIGDSVVTDIHKTMQLCEEEGGYFEYKKESYVNAIDEIEDYKQMVEGDK